MSSVDKSKPVAIIGANGQIGRLLIPRLVEKGYLVRAMVRNADQIESLKQVGAQDVVVANLEGSLDDVVTDCSAIIFTAGSGAKTGADKTILIDLWGAIKSIDTAKRHNIQRYLMVSARLADDPEQGAPVRRHYLVAKHLADNHLIESELDYSILRPGRLTNEPPTGRVRTDRPDDPNEQFITRADVADTLVHCLDAPETVHLVCELFAGNHTISDALANA